MSLLSKARRDWRRHITAPEDFGEDITFIDDSGAEIVVRGLAMDHHLGVDEDGNPTNSRNSHITVPESLLVEVGITVRDENDEVDLLNKRVSFVNSAGIRNQYVIKQNFADETVGVIYCVLGLYGDS